MFFPTLATLTFLVASVAASPSPVMQARAANPTVYMRIEGPTKTIYEETIVPSPAASLTNNGHTARCDGLTSTPGVTSLTALQQTGQFFESSWNGTNFGSITKINGTSNNATDQWGVLINDVTSDGGGTFVLEGADNYDDPEYDYCTFVLPNKQHMLYAFFGDIDSTNFMFMYGPSTAKVGVTVEYTVLNTLKDAYINDLSEDTTVGQRVYAWFNSAAAIDTHQITFTEAGTYNLKAHCPAGSACVRSNHVVTVVSK